MSKSIFAMDTPKSCSECSLFKDIGLDTKWFICVGNHNDLTKHNIETIHPQCPLQPAEPLLEKFNEIVFNELNNDTEYYYKDTIELIRKALGG